MFTSVQAAVMRHGRLIIDEIDDPEPAAGQVLARTIACGICGSDLHALRHGDKMVEMSRIGALEAGPVSPHVMDLSHDVVMGHEFCAEVVELGRNTGQCQEGDIVVSMPVLFAPSGLHPLGYSNDYPGGYAERMVLSDMLTLAVPNGLDPRHAALTEPMAVGVHAVNKSGIAPGEAAVVLGCGPVGLAVTAALARLGVDTIVAADFSATRRELATIMGATETVDPSTESAVQAWRRVDGRKSLVMFEAVGVPGMIDEAMLDAPRGGRLVIVGVCMETDRLRPMLGVMKELSIQFALGYDPTEFADTLRAIAEGEFDVAPLITGSVDLPGVPQAFEELADPDRHAKILVEPAQPGVETCR